MIWNNIELFNVYETEQRVDGALKLYRFPKSVRNRFAIEKPSYIGDVGNMTTGCELRFVTKAVDILLSSEYDGGTVEIFRGDFLCRVERIPAGVVTRISLRDDTALDCYALEGYKGRFSPNVWRLVFDHDHCAVIHDVHPFTPIRPPMPSEVPQRKILAYGSSITHSAGAVLFSNSYVYTMAKSLGVDVLCKGMGGSCLIQPEVAAYLPTETWDVALLELGINMIEAYPVSVFEERATHLIKCVLKQRKPVVLISNYTSYNNIEGCKFKANNDAYVNCLEGIYKRLKCDNLFYIRGQDIVTDWEYLGADLLHPSPYGHVEMGRKIADILRNKFKII